MTRAIRLFRAFSLVELLVVMAIVAILAGLAFPTLAAMRERGRRVKCMNNIRQIALAMHTYASDHDGFFYSPTNNYTAIVATPMYYSGVFWTGSSWAGPMHLWEGMSNYIKNTEVLYCPTALQKKLQYS
ncbi:MAG: type II secretion system protein, partial [Verrucomicrobiae bacterium]|nr:type II secretion system protein [Verrucomicrobiae bacterium]